MPLFAGYSILCSGKLMGLEPNIERNKVIFLIAFTVMGFAPCTCDQRCCQIRTAMLSGNTPQVCVAVITALAAQLGQGSALQYMYLCDDHLPISKAEHAGHRRHEAPAWLLALC